MSDNLKSMFEPYNGDNIHPLQDDSFVVWVPYAHSTPIVVQTMNLATQVEAAITEAHKKGVWDGQSD